MVQPIDWSKQESQGLQQKLPLHSIAIFGASPHFQNLAFPPTFHCLPLCHSLSHTFSTHTQKQKWSNRESRRWYSKNKRNKKTYNTVLSLLNNFRSIFEFFSFSLGLCFLTTRIWIYLIFKVLIFLFVFLFIFILLLS